jgi:hypothetical protein
MCLSVSQSQRNAHTVVETVRAVLFAGHKCGSLHSGFVMKN